ncbi:aldo/keto reductase, partial [Gemmatimonas sp.]|uniref:aldo/keto reductase n=1 Tax=Gemmatimonas sp. TaxID=1962908 RepID=UPI0035639A30
HTLRGIADAHHTTIGAVALRAVLDEPAVTAVIVGARHAEHLPATLAALSLEFTAAERASLQSVVAAAPGPRGDVYDLERDMTGVHAGIMRYNLNTA